MPLELLLPWPDRKIMATSLLVVCFWIQSSPSSMASLVASASVSALPP